jgi:hypothetical protein
MDIALKQLREIDAGLWLKVRDQQFVVYRGICGSPKLSPEQLKPITRFTSYDPFES